MCKLCRAFSVSGKVRPEEAVQATLSSLPDEVVDTVGVTALSSDDSVSERRRKLEFLETEEEMIKVYAAFVTLIQFSIYYDGLYSSGNSEVMPFPLFPFHN